MRKGPELVYLVGFFANAHWRGERQVDLDRAGRAEESARHRAVLNDRPLR